MIDWTLTAEPGAFYLVPDAYYVIWAPGSRETLYQFIDGEYGGRLTSVEGGGATSLYALKQLPGAMILGPLRGEVMLL